MSSWKLRTYTWDGHGIDNLNGGMSINFFCEFPCSTCSLTQNDLCYSCYGNSASKWIHFFENKCLDNCPNGYFNTFTNLTEDGDDLWTCGECAPPCMTCGQNATDCLTCLPGNLLYDVDHTCYQEIFWYFPFVISSFLVILLVWLVDCLWRDTNILHSVIFFLAFIEDGAMAMIVIEFI